MQIKMPKPKYYTFLSYTFLLCEFQGDLIFVVVVLFSETGY